MRASTKPHTERHSKQMAFNHFFYCVYIYCVKWWLSLIEYSHLMRHLSKCGQFRWFFVQISCLQCEPQHEVYINFPSAVTNCQWTLVHVLNDCGCPKNILSFWNETVHLWRDNSLNYLNWCESGEADKFIIFANASHLNEILERLPFQF